MILNYTEYKAKQGPFLQTILEHQGEKGYLRAYLIYLKMFDLDPIAIKAIERYHYRMKRPLLNFSHEYCPSVEENINPIINWIHKKYF